MTHMNLHLVNGEWHSEVSLLARLILEKLRSPTPNLSSNTLGTGSTRGAARPSRGLCDLRSRADTGSSNGTA